MSRGSILITGCSSGTGLDAALTLRARGWRVFASCRKASDCELLKQQGFDSPLIDYSQEETIKAGFAEVIAATGGTLDALYNNGAYGIQSPTEELPTAALRELFEANFFGWHTLTQLAIKVMRQQGPRGRGRIVQHCSGFGLFAGPFRAAYCASKHALEAHTQARSRLEPRAVGRPCTPPPSSPPAHRTARAQCLRLELADTDISVSILNTGLIRTMIREKSRIPFNR